jgi:hypothetical protein
MMYFEKNQPHYLVWPVLAFGKDDIQGFWIGIGWLNKEIGWKENGYTEKKQDGNCKKCKDGCPACDVRKLTKELKNEMP